MRRTFGPSQGNRRAPVAAPGRPAPTQTSRGKTVVRPTASVRTVPSHLTSVPSSRGTKVVPITNTVKIGDRRFTPAQAKVLKQIGKGTTKNLPSDIPPSIAKLDIKFGKRYHIPPSVLASDQRQESGFDPSAVSSAGAGGVSQFMPGTAASYGVKYGTSPKAVKSQVKGQAAYLSDLGFNQDPQKALSSYSGGYSAGSYNNPVLAGSKDYKALDKPQVNPKAVRKAKQLGIKHPLKAAGTTGGVRAPGPKILSRYKAIKVAAHQIGEQHHPYQWGGGHVAGKIPLGQAVDCSAAVREVLQRAGYKIPSLVSGQFGAVTKPGPGAVTVFYNSEHVFMKIGSRYFGTSSADNPGGGAGFIKSSVAAPEAQSGKYSVGHIPGLGRKTAMQLGVPLTSSSFPGMTVSGTTATINPGAGTTQNKPGLSSSPIQLTPAQRAKRTFTKLRKLGVGADETSSSKVSLTELERRYGKAAV